MSWQMLDESIGDSAQTDRPKCRAYPEALKIYEDIRSLYTRHRQRSAARSTIYDSSSFGVRIKKAGVQLQA